LSEFIASFIQYFSGSQKRRNILFATLILAALAIRVFLLWVPSWDVDSIQSKWYDELIKVGRIDAFAEIFYNYTPAPVYLIDIVTLFRFIPKEPAMKLITVIFDFLGAWGIWKILKLRFPKGSVAWLGFFAFLFLPTVFVESAMWGQTDILFTTFLIWSFYYVLKEKTWPAMFFFWTTRHGPAWIMVTGMTRPSSVNIWVMPIFFPIIPCIIFSPSCLVRLHLDLDSGRQIHFLQFGDRVVVVFANLYQPGVRAAFEMLARFLVGMR